MKVHRPQYVDHTAEPQIGKEKKRTQTNLNRLSLVTAEAKAEQAIEARKPKFHRHRIETGLFCIFGERSYCKFCQEVTVFVLRFTVRHVSADFIFAEHPCCGDCFKEMNERARIYELDDDGIRSSDTEGQPEMLLLSVGNEESQQPPSGI